MIASSNNLADAGEDCWIDEDYCRQNGLWYHLSKVLAEKAAWKFAEENGLDVVVVNPGVVVGPMLPPALNSSMKLILQILQGKDFPEELFMALVHVKDVALAHILLYENTSATGRHLCVESLSRYDDFVVQMEKLYPEYKLPRFLEDARHGSSKSNAAASKKLIDLGIEFAPLEQIVKDSIQSLRWRDQTFYTLEKLVILSTFRRSTMVNKEEEVVCVTGASGFIGSWVVHLLLRRGYAVHATVKNLDDESETKHLEALEGADSRLRLFQIDLLDYDTIVAAISGAAGVLHLASPCTIDQVRDPQRELLDPAVKGTINVLTAAKNLDVRRVVVTSSISAMIASSNCLADAGEDCWIDEDYCRQNGLWYPLSKVLAEKAAWKFAEQNGLDIVVVNPGMVVGPIFPPSLNSSMQLILDVLQGKDFPEGFFMALVHVKDVALALILLYENTSAAGRHLCVESLSRYGDFAKQMETLYPEYKLPRLSNDTQTLLGSPKSNAASQKLIDLGVEFTPLEQTVKDAIESLRSKGYVS